MRVEEGEGEQEARQRVVVGQDEHCIHGLPAVPPALGALIQTLQQQQHVSNKRQQQQHGSMN